MSGGHFDYKQYHIGQIADEVERLIKLNDSKKVDDYGDPISRGYSPEIIERFSLALKTLRNAALMAQRIDWLVSCDDGPDDFLEWWNEEIKKED